MTLIIYIELFLKVKQVGTLNIKLIALNILLFIMYDKPIIDDNKKPRPINFKISKFHKGYEFLII